jgi:hypothetical protein
VPRPRTKDLDSPKLHLREDRADPNKDSSPNVQILQRERQASKDILEPFFLRLSDQGLFENLEVTGFGCSTAREVFYFRALQMFAEFFEYLNLVFERH